MSDIDRARAAIARIPALKDRVEPERLGGLTNLVSRVDDR